MESQKIDFKILKVEIYSDGFLKMQIITQLHFLRQFLISVDSTYEYVITDECQNLHLTNIATQ